MPVRGFPLDTEAIILFELARGFGTAPELLRRARARMEESGYALHYGTWYPALSRLERRELLNARRTKVSFRQGRANVTKVYYLTEKGQEEARRLSSRIRVLLIPEAPA
ncbi:MAG TPA: PadR family transcriptional regulator [Patescibacteria group bacterium]|nr:PadR family transcriptional regulator [Patescibacteria group bacterium]